MNCILALMNEADLVALLKQRLRQEGTEVISVSSGNDVLTWLYKSTPDMILLDMMASAIDGYEICRRIRAVGKRPLAILMLSERATVADKVKGLESGADDYIARPFDVNELLARIRAGLRRVNELTKPLQRLEIGDLVIDMAARQVWRSGELVELTRREYDLLVLLAKNAGHVLTKDYIFDHVWGWDSQANWEVIKVYMNYLRVKLNKGGKTDLIRAVRGVGYALRPKVSAPVLASTH
jgi:DNA-binding response OmpR family regulator